MMQQKMSRFIRKTLSFSKMIENPAGDVRYFGIIIMLLLADKPLIL